jgi:hypothetical protein
MQMRAVLLTSLWLAGGCVDLLTDLTPQDMGCRGGAGDGGPDGGGVVACAPLDGGGQMIRFTTDIQPDLDSFACSSTSCHGAMAPVQPPTLLQSRMAAAIDANYDAFVKEAMSGTDSLALTKPTNQVSHSGGKLFDKESTTYAKWLQWIRAGRPK